MNKKDKYTCDYLKDIIDIQIVWDTATTDIPKLKKTNRGNSLTHEYFLNLVIMWTQFQPRGLGRGLEKYIHSENSGTTQLKDM